MSVEAVVAVGETGSPLLGFQAVRPPEERGVAGVVVRNDILSILDRTARRALLTAGSVIGTGTEKGILGTHAMRTRAQPLLGAVVETVCHPAAFPGTIEEVHRRMGPHFERNPKWRVKVMLRCSHHLRHHLLHPLLRRRLRLRHPLGQIAEISQPVSPPSWNRPLLWSVH